MKNIAAISEEEEHSSNETVKEARRHSRVAVSKRNSTSMIKTSSTGVREVSQPSATTPEFTLPPPPRNLSSKCSS